MRLPGRQMEMERVTVAVAQQVEFRGEAPAGPPQRMVRRFGRLFFWVFGRIRG